MSNKMLRYLLLIVWGMLATAVWAEDGYRLWLRYEPIADAKLLQDYRDSLRQVVLPSSFQGDNVIWRELQAGLSGLMGVKELPAVDNVSQEGALVIGTPDASDTIKKLIAPSDLKACGPEGYLIRSMKVNGYSATVIAANTQQGLLYGVFHFLRLLQTNQSIKLLDIAEHPTLELRLMNHWDNLDGSIERGYAGRSIWQWDQLPQKLSPRYTDYARACASIGINGAVINNVNADPRILSPEYLHKVAALANVWRPYGVRMYLSINFASPVRLGGLQTADPLDPDVIDWWKAKADEIYDLIPDFGGFLVKANSEGQPGPKTYGRSHAEGANMLADALAPHNGVVMWRAFVYDADVDPDRAKRAYLEFTQLDGQFRPNVVIQVKNGPIDFQPREPFHPLFGGMKQTPVIAEIQATQEYLGQAKHLVYLGTLWKEFLDSDTYAKGSGSTVADVLAGNVYHYPLTGMVSVTNPGLDTNWCGHHFSQSNWYAFGRLAWNPKLSAETIAEEWTRMTFTNDAKTVAVIRDMMMGSRETYVNYTMPLGLHHLIGGNHYAPTPWNDSAPRADWTATYYHQASPDGIGFDRTRQGTNAVEQYFPPVCDTFDDITKCPEKLLLWFHHVPWDYRMKSGKTLWAELREKYQQGAAQTVALQTTWQSLEGTIDARRYGEVADRLAIQVADAAKWSEQIVDYFGQFAKTQTADADNARDVTDPRGKMKPWDKGAWETGKYRNVFREAGYEQEAIDAKLAKAYYDLFEGPNRVYFEVGDDMAYVSDLKNHDARTEGLSYGMMVAVQLDKKDVFDRLWRWTVKYMQHQDGPREAYFAWSVNPETGRQNSPGSASDGEFYFVTDLLFASNRWGNDMGIDYYAEARRILDAMWSKDGTNGIRNVINTEHKMITFVPEGRGYNWTDPSYHLPAFFEVWAQYARDGHEDFYRQCADISRQFLHKACHPVTGLTPDYAEFDGSPLGGRMSAFGFDSWRVPMNIAMDYSWYAKDKDWQQDYCSRLQNFLFARGIDTFEDQFNPDGTARERIMGAGGYRTLRHSLGWVSTTGAASLMSTQAKGWKFVDAVWNAKLQPYEDGYFDPYYDGFLYLFSLMHLSGNYRIITPAAVESH